MIYKRISFGLLFLLTVLWGYSIEKEWFFGAGMGWPAGITDFYFLNEEKAEKADLYAPGETTAIISLGESYGIRSGLTLTNRMLVASASFTLGAVFPHASIYEVPETSTADNPELINSTHYSERPNFSAISLDLLLGFRFPVTKRLFLQLTGGGVVSADLWYFLEEREVSINYGDNTKWSAPREIRFAWGGAGELGFFTD